MHLSASVYRSEQQRNRRTEVVAPMFKPLQCKALPLPADPMPYVMDRRAAFLALLSTFFAQRAGPQRLQREPGELTIDLNQWTMLKLKYKDFEPQEIPVQVIWEELTK